MRWLEPTPLLFPDLLPDLHPLVAQTLLQRGISTAEAARAFLDADKYSPALSSELPGLNDAAERVERAIRTSEPICVWGDFDVDGQTSTTVLVQTLLVLGADVRYHIPVRERESHGVNLPHLKEIIDQGAKLILTCDTGITAHKAVEYAHTRDVDMVITDHHDIPESLPHAAAIVNPKILAPNHALGTLAGVGVAYKLAEKLITSFPDAPMAAGDLLDLVALGLVADMTILKGDSRYLVQKGLVALRNTQRIGLKVMLEMAELVPANLSEEHISFMLAPRLNSLGRLGDANPAVDLLTTTNMHRARLLANQLENYNIQRQTLCNQVMQAAEAALLEDKSPLEKAVLVLTNPNWPSGVIGIVASRLVERYRKPVILFSTPANEPAHGSARSVEGLNITSAIAAQKDLLISFGGHPMAAGLALEKEKLHEFSHRLFRTVEKMLGEVIDEEPVLRIDAWFELPDVTPNLAEEIEKLAPFGAGNEKLTLATHNLTVHSSRKIGRNKEHLILIVADNSGCSQKVLWWSGAGETLPEGVFDLAYSVRTSDWRGNRQVQMELEDFRVIEQKQVEIKSQKLEIVDQRNNPNPLGLLPVFHNQGSTLVWAEADAKIEAGGKDRNELVHAEHLVLWTIPPSPVEFRMGLETVKPRMVTFVGAHPDLESTEPFIARLAGLIKFAITHRSGKVSLAELAAATSQRRITVELGVNWLVANGKFKLIQKMEDQLWLTPGETRIDPGDPERLMLVIQSLLAETAAYRAYFKHAEIDALLP